ncbi:hypothetical protein EIN_135810 [Entamoeba invadens IP1]|uniref:Uncharacterized protein n=1 Tax=Entamoeba invadens IP1 TaxID=370355 RepID=A0A0A1TXE5_ENTIV|nr:hypothetical protein EIN_135810 [Entamoeba invadens IP1]ELP85957.1 hypothetical protein EIN_135810 [Entamoeba invadens IP1]|eukprot:XP_004185303.1 hypothetical protein EIN_135810 [Entamoeba invadens IP1]
MFPNLKNVKLYPKIQNVDMTKFFTQRQKRFHNVKIKFDTATIDYEFLKNVSSYNIENLKIKLDVENEIISRVALIPKIFSYAHIVVEDWFENIDDRIYVKNMTFRYKNESLYTKYLPNKIMFTSEFQFDLTNWNSVQNLTVDSKVSFRAPTEITSLSIKGTCENIEECCHLRELKIIGENEIVVPSTVESLKCVKCHQKLLKIDNFRYIKKLSLTKQKTWDLSAFTGLTSLKLKKSTILSNLNHLQFLQKIVIDESYCCDEKWCYPSSVQVLVCESKDIENECPMTSLTVSCEVVPFDMRSCRVEEICIKDGYPEGTVLPLRIKRVFLDGVTVKELNFEEYDAMEELWMTNCYIDDMTFPINLKQLVIYSFCEFQKTNLNEVKLEKFTICSRKFNIEEVNEDLKEIFVDNKDFKKEVYSRFKKLQNIRFIGGIGMK